MEHQHRTILAAIRAGRFDAKLEQAVGGREPERAEPETLLARRRSPPRPGAGARARTSRSPADHRAAARRPMAPGAGLRARPSTR